MKNIDQNKKKAIRNYSPGTHFISLFGAPDIVNVDDQLKTEAGGEIYVKGKYEYRLIFDGKNSWSDIINP